MRSAKTHRLRTACNARQAQSKPASAPPCHQEAALRTQFDVLRQLLLLALKGDAGSNQILNQSARAISTSKKLFGSMRFTKPFPKSHALHLKERLSEFNIELIIIDVRAGNSIFSEVFTQMESCDAFLCFGTRDYGKDTRNIVSLAFAYPSHVNSSLHIPFRFI